MKRLGFLSFGHWQRAQGSLVRSAQDALLQTIELAVAAEEIGIDGAFVRVHHFSPQLAAPFPLLGAIAASTRRIELGTAVIDMRYENPLYLAEEAAATDLISGGRLQLGLSRGSPEPSLDGSREFGYLPDDGDTDADDARRRTAAFRSAISGRPVARANPRMTSGSGHLAIQPQSPGLAERIWWGSGTRRTARWAGEQGMNLMSSTLLAEDTGAPFHEQQAEQISVYRESWAAAGWAHRPRVSVSRSILPITTDADRLYFGRERDSRDQVGYLEGGVARFGKTYVGAPDDLAEQLSSDSAVQDADTLLITVPNQFGVDYCARMLETIARDIAPAVGWQRSGDPILR